MNHFVLYLKSILKHIIALLLFLLVICNTSVAQIQNGSFMHDGFNRDYIVFLPQNYQPNMPVVFNLHGYTDYAQWQMDYSLMNDIADTAGFIVVYPDAVYPGFNTGLIGSPTWPPLPTTVDDVGFISAIIDTLESQYNIDLNRVYCCGLSNGGLMTLKLACQLGHRFAGFAAVAGVLIDPIVSNYSFVGPVPMLLCHGTDDVVVYYNGGPYQMLWSVQETMNFWTQNNSCVLTPDTVAIPDTCLSDSSYVQKISYRNCSDSVQVVLYKVIHGGHSWPGSDVNITWGTEGNKNRDINANVELWKFFKNYSNPYTDIAYGKSIDMNPKFLQLSGDTLWVSGKICNSQNHQVEVSAKIQGENHAYLDSLQMFDDGLHGDGNPNDNIWGAVKYYSNLTEDNYLVYLLTKDITENTRHQLAFPTRFTTRGPVVFDKYNITSTDTIPNHGNKLKFEFLLNNSGLTDTVMNITSRLYNLDTNSTLTGTIIPEYGNIAPGESALGNKKQYIKFNPLSPDSVNAKFRIDVYSDNLLFWSDTFSIFITKDPAGIETNNHNLPEKYELEQNYPNPFNPITNIQFSIPKPEFVTLKIYNLLGQEVATLISENLNAGEYNYSWNADSFASGVYLYRLQAGSNIEIRKMILLQ